MKNIHLTLDNRIFIEKCLDQGKSIHQIAVNLGKSDSSIAREIQRNRYKMPVKQTNYYPCIHRLSMCGVMHLCDADCNRFCNGCVGYCSTGKCKDYTLVANRNATLTDLMLFLNSIAFRLSFIYLKEKELSHTKQLFTLWQSIIITYK